MSSVLPSPLAPNARALTAVVAARLVASGALAIPLGAAANADVPNNPVRTEDCCTNRRRERDEWNVFMNERLTEKTPTTASRKAHARSFETIVSLHLNWHFDLIAPRAASRA